MGFIPNNQQKIGLSLGYKWFKSQYKQCFEISGIAGSGKTTMVYYLIQELGLELDEVAFVAFIGKAALNMCRKGTPATTIHHLIYNMEEETKYDDDGAPVKDETTGREVRIPKFVRKAKLPDNIKLIVVDEGAMVSDTIARDLLSFNLPVIVLGDRNQLPPVMGKSFFLMHPDVELTEPMRQALDSPIIYLAQRAMLGKDIKIGKYSDNVFVIPKDMISDKMLINSDVVICHRNATREEINRHVRADILKKKNTLPDIGDKMICRKNNWSKSIDKEIFLINGLIGYVEDVDKSSYNRSSVNIDFRPEFLEDAMFHNLKIDYKYLTASYEEKEKFSRSYYEKFEYAYAITCHLAQGSEYDKVLVYSEDIYNGSTYRKWLYTAITRSSNSLILAI